MKANPDASEIDFITVNSDKKIYKLKLCKKNLYLTATGANNVLLWDEYSGNDNQLFRLIENNNTFTSNDNYPKIQTLHKKFVPAFTGNCTKNRVKHGGRITQICIHHMAGNLSINFLGYLWQTTGRNGSSHYGINGTDIGQYVSEDDIAWTNSNWQANINSVTIEVANDKNTPEWTVSDNSLRTLINLVSDIARRNNLGTLIKGQNVTWHKMYTNTVCPGPYLLSKMQIIVAEANNLNCFTFD